MSKENYKSIPEDYRIPYQTLYSTTLEKLADRPRTGADLRRLGGNDAISPMMRLSFVTKISVTTSTSRRARGSGIDGNFEAVYCLDGDERRGVRRFIAANEDNTRKVLESSSSLFHTAFDDYILSVLYEEWQFEWYKNTEEYKNGY